MANTFVQRLRQLLVTSESSDQTWANQPAAMASSSSTHPDQAYSSPVSNSEVSARRRPPYRRPLYYRPLFWILLVAGAVSATGVSRAYRIWHATEAELPAVTDLKTFERKGTNTIKSEDNAILQKIGPSKRQK
ncbi:MAG: hypothetical protein ACFBSG_17765, partial [Leptolyngbyaceae cyanobacterium]